MKCALAREALSARLDGEDEPVPADRLDEHLANCPDCRSWYAVAGRMTRRVRVSPAPPIPDLSAQILAAQPVAAPRRATARTVSRVLLALTGAAQLTVALAQALGVDFGMTAAHGEHAAAMSAHLLNETTAWTAALGVGFLTAALRPRTVAGLLPMVAAFVVVLGGYAAVDGMQDRVTVARLASHSLVLLGALLLMLLARTGSGVGGRRRRIGRKTGRADTRGDASDPVTSARGSSAA
ncbi:zf-HC2 domain-containing protein [Nocardia sp. IBHARD005]|uniref:zf-HC2 domain-containing protein n=1 Tax=Nocardia sp. IBHARD005 TaxID=3457765 RepID=UPI004058601B